MTEQNRKLSFGFKEWLGLATLALTPAAGFTSWGFAISQRVAVVEANQNHLVQIVERLDDRSHWERLTRLESEVQNLRPK